MHSINNFFRMYKNNSEIVLNELDEYLSNQNLDNNTKKYYRKMYLRQYSNIKYNVKKESINDNKASVDVIINVFDYYNSLKESNSYVLENELEFINENGDIDTNKILRYRINNMLNTNNRVDYLLTLYLSRKNGTWKIDKISNSDLMKIHGVYEY